MSAKVKRTVVLVVEDNPADVAFFKEAVDASQVPVSVYEVPHGEEALAFLRRRGRFADAPRPDVVVLDLNLPVMNGQEMLVNMMSEPDLRSIPVVVLTTSWSERRVIEICPPGRCLYFTKTDDFRELQDIVRSIVQHADAGVAASE